MNAATTAFDAPPPNAADAPDLLARPALPPFMVRVKQAARLCGVSTPTWHRLAAAGKTPASVKLGGATLYRLDELEAWCRHGCPPRREWSAIWESLCDRAA